MFKNNDQVSNATKALFEDQVAKFHILTGSIVESMEQVIALNVAAVKAASEESAAAARQLLAAKDPQEFMTFVSDQAKLNAEKVQSYGRHLAEITTSAKDDLSKVVESQMAETKDKVTSLISDVTKNAPAGSEKAVAMLKTAMDNANAGYEQLTKSTKQAVATVEENVAKATEQFSQGVEKVTAKIGKK